MQEGRDDHFRRIKEDFFDAVVGFLVGKITKQVGFQFQFGGFIFAAAAMRIRCADIQKKWLVRRRTHKLLHIVGHLDDIAAVSLECMIELIHGLWSNVVLPDAPGTIAGFTE